MKVSVRAGHILSPSLWPSAVGRATELCPALPETFLSLQGDLTSLHLTCKHLPVDLKYIVNTYVKSLNLMYLYCLALEQLKAKLTKPSPNRVK